MNRDVESLCSKKNVFLEKNLYLRVYDPLKNSKRIPFSADRNLKFSEHILSILAVFKATSKLFGSHGCSDDKNCLDFSCIVFKIYGFCSSILLTLQITGHFGFVFHKLGQGNHMIIVTPSFSKSSVFFSSTPKQKAGVFKLLQFVKRCRKVPFSCKFVNL